MTSPDGALSVAVNVVPVPSALDVALAQYNAGVVDMGNDPVGSGRQLGLRRLAKLEAEFAALPRLPPETGGSLLYYLSVIIGAIAFTYLYRYLTRR